MGYSNQSMLKMYENILKSSGEAYTCLLTCQSSGTGWEYMLKFKLNNQRWLWQSNKKIVKEDTNKILHYFKGKETIMGYKE